MEPTLAVGDRVTFWIHAEGVAECWTGMTGTVTGFENHGEGPLADVTWDCGDETRERVCSLVKVKPEHCEHCGAYASRCHVDLDDGSEEGTTICAVSGIEVA